MSNSEKTTKLRGPCSTGDGEICIPCGCGNQPPYHCMWCCRDFDEEGQKQLKAEDEGEVSDER